MDHVSRVESAISDLRQLIKLYSKGLPLDGADDFNSENSSISSLKNRKRATDKDSTQKQPQSPKRSPEKISAQFESFIDTKSKINSVNLSRKRTLFQRWKGFFLRQAISAKSSPSFHRFSASPGASDNSSYYSYNCRLSQGRSSCDASAQAVGGAMSSDNGVIQDSHLPRFPSNLLVNDIDANTAEEFREKMAKIAYEGSPKGTKPAALSLSSSSHQSGNVSPKSRHDSFVSYSASSTSIASNYSDSNPEAEALREHLQNVKYANSSSSTLSQNSDKESSNPEAEALLEHLKNSKVQENEEEEELFPQLQPKIPTQKDGKSPQKTKEQVPQQIKTTPIFEEEDEEESEHVLSDYVKGLREKYNIPDSHSSGEASQEHAASPIKPSLGHWSDIEEDPESDDKTNIKNEDKTESDNLQQNLSDSPIHFQPIKKDEQYEEEEEEEEVYKIDKSNISKPNQTKEFSLNIEEEEEEEEEFKAEEKIINSPKRNKELSLNMEEEDDELKSESGNGRELSLDDLLARFSGKDGFGEEEQNDEI